MAALTAAPRTGAVAPTTLTSPVELGYDASANLAFEHQVHAALQRMAADGHNGLCLPLVTLPAGASAAPGGAALPAGCGELPSPAPVATVHAVVLRDGAIWRIASSFEPGIDRPLGLGSVAKAVLALPLLALDSARVDEGWCERQGALQGGDDMVVPGASAAACQPDARIRARDAFAASRNGALIDRLRRIPAVRIREELVAAQLQGAAALRYPAVAVPLGLVELTPRQALECFDALASGRARRAAFLRQALAEPSAMGHWCASVVADPQRQAYVHEMLRAPGEPGGTAAYAVHVLPPAPRGDLAPLAKTGTPSDAGRRDLGKTLLVSFVVGTHRYTALLVVVSPLPGLPLARRLPGDFLWPLVQLVGQHALP